MSVVNVKVQYIRPKYRNLKEWMASEDNVYIGRCGVVFIDGKRFPPVSTGGKGGIFANPYKVGRDGDLDEVLKNYEEWLKEEINAGRITKSQLSALKGKNLGCWCKPNKCHGDVLLRYVNSLTN